MPLRGRPAALLRLTGWIVIAVVIPSVIYLLAAFGGALLARNAIPANTASERPVQAETARRIYLVTGLLHADIALPVSEELLSDFGVLRHSDLPLDHPRLQYLAFGWGSRAFYTTAGSYSDITFSAAWQAATGDEPVMRVTPLGALVPGENVIAVNITGSGYRNLVAAIKNSFTPGADNLPIHLAGESIGPGDAFFLAEGHFNVFVPCNQWVGDMLHAAGAGIGIWTPTTHSLVASLRWHNTMPFAGEQ